MDLGRVGVWSGELRFAKDDGEVREASQELEELGYGALWLPGGPGGDILGACRRVLAATSKVVVATGILNVWMHDPAEVAKEHAALQEEYPGRFLLGIGISHALLIDQIEGMEYRKPLTKMRSYLDGLDAGEPPVPVDERIVAALGPKMMELSRDRAAGTHPYFVGPEHTAAARAAVGPGKLVAPEQAVCLDTEVESARAAARKFMALYLQLPNYTNNLLRHGFTQDDLADGGSDRLVDTIVNHGDEAAIAANVAKHYDAGADHVCIQVITAEGRGALPREQWRALAGALT